MINVERERLVEEKPHHFTAEASELRFPPGIWPNLFTVVPVFGNGLPFLRIGGTRDYSEYRQNLGCVTITVFND